MQQGRNLYFPRGEIPLDRSMDKGFVAHQMSDLEATCVELERRLSASFQKQLDLIHGVTTVPYVRSVAAQCLNRVLGGGPPPTFRVFVVAVADCAPNAPKRVAQAVFGTSPTIQAGIRADQVMTRHHQDQYAGDLAAAVERAWQILLCCPVVRAQCPDEMLVLRKYREDPDLFRA